jgi:nicotinamide-nucleotide amidase
MRAEIISIGSELVSGQSLDTNSRWISQELSSLGIPVAFHTTLGDVLDDHRAVFQNACDRAELVVITGGLGPTQDDLTREALAECAGVPLVEDPESLSAIAAMFARRNRAMPDRNRVQAVFPKGAEPLPNPVGTAPGIWMRLGKATIACLPGVPSEMKVMFQGQVVPRLKQLGVIERVFAHRKINLFGKGESDFESQALDLTARGRIPEVGITAHEGTISFRITASGKTENEALLAIEPTAKLIYERFGSLVLGEGSEDVADALVNLLIRTGKTLATAESCTGGLIAHLITAIAGVSPYYPGGVVSYANQAKTELLGVPPALIEIHGAVSPEVAAAMAEGVRKRLGADLGLSATGVAGPSGGTADKPVGLVYLGLATARRTETRRLDFGSEQPRDIIQQRSAKSALNWVRLTLLENR